MVRRLSNGAIYALLGALLVAAIAASAGIGALSFTPGEMTHYLASALGVGHVSETDLLGRNVFLTLRLPRVALAGLTGAVLGVSGTLMQGLFRNPIVEPGLAGTSAGAALGAALVFVLGGHTTLAFTAPLGSLAVPVAAFAGGFAATMLVYRVSTSFGKVNVFTLLLAGIAVNAVCSAGTGFLSYIARDPQARNITFWNLGTFTTAEWHGVVLVGIAFALCFIVSLRSGKALNALMLGEDDAAFLGVDPSRLILRLIIINTIMVAIATAMVGVTGEVRYDGRPVSAFPPDALARTRAVLSQHVDLAFALPVEDVVLMGRYPHYGRVPTAHDRAIVERALEVVGMTDKRRQPYPTLSGGEQQKVHLARVLAQIWCYDEPHTPSYLFLDEPTTSLDIHYQIHLLDIARELLAHDCTVIAILHDLNVAFQYGDAFLLLDQGRVARDVDAVTDIPTELIERVFRVRAVPVADPSTGDRFLRFAL